MIDSICYVQKNTADNNIVNSVQSANVHRSTGFKHPRPDLNPRPLHVLIYLCVTCVQPDFTLDIHRAELLMMKIKTAKRRRCWCRLMTSLLGLIFFLMSVMVVSMAVSRGKRIFGPI